MTIPPASVIEIAPLTGGRFADLAALFDEGGDPKRCWCTWYRRRNADLSRAGAAENRALLADLAERAPAPGLVAYRDGRAVGWVSLGPREDFDRLAHSTILAPLDDRPVWSIVCFVVSRSERGRGVARALLDAAVAYARALGATMVEAYPVDTGAGRISAAEAFRGTTPMFEKAGFEVAARRSAPPRGKPRPIVRRALAP